MVQSNSGTLIRPPPYDSSKSLIENALELTPVADIGPDIFTNTRPLWHPPGARGIYGGAAIAQSLAAAQLTIPPPSKANGYAEFWVHSMHCYFVLAGDSSIPVLYHVERVREGKSFMTRTVQARQRGKCIFTTTLSFMREGSPGKETIGHEVGFPEGVVEALEKEQKKARQAPDESLGDSGGGPFESIRLDIINNASPNIHTKRTRQWIRARGQITPSAGTGAHLEAMAYMSDSYFIGTVSRVHNLWRFGPPKPSKRSDDPTQRQLAAAEAKENSSEETRRIGMMVSLDHTIYFHRPRDIKADDWLLAEMDSPWVGDGRGLVFQRIWNSKGQLVATCVQEGLVRLVQPGESAKL